jgi:hypothetical protein
MSAEPELQAPTYGNQATGKVDHLSAIICNQNKNQGLYCNEFIS